jgi:hypothetical protein
MTQEWPEGRIAGSGTLWEREMWRMERVRDEEERLCQTDIRWQGTSLVGALPWPKGASKCGALWVLCGMTLLQLDRVGCHYPWCPTMHLWRHPSWRSVLGSRYGKRLPMVPFEKMFSRRAKIKKNYIVGPDHCTLHGPADTYGSHRSQYLFGKCCPMVSLFYFNPFEKLFSQIDPQGNLFHLWTQARAPGLLAP